MPSWLQKINICGEVERKVEVAKTTYTVLPSLFCDTRETIGRKQTLLRGEEIKKMTLE